MRFSQILLSCLILCSHGRAALASQILPNTSMQYISPLHYRPSEIRLVSRLIVAAISGSVVGWERGSTKHCAGVRTMALVSLGAAAFTICSAYGFGGKGDPARMAAAIVSGVGFLGAGVITTDASGCDRFGNKNNMVHGLTTAAAIWLSASLGVVCGLGLYILSSAIALITVGILRLGKHQENEQRKRNEVDASNHQKSEEYSRSDLFDAGTFESYKEKKIETPSTSSGRSIDTCSSMRQMNVEEPVAITLSQESVKSNPTELLDVVFNPPVFTKESFIDENADNLMENIISVQNSTTIESQYKP